MDCHCQRRFLGEAKSLRSNIRSLAKSIRQTGLLFAGPVWWMGFVLVRQPHCGRQGTRATRSPEKLMSFSNILRSVETEGQIHAAPPFQGPPGSQEAVKGCPCAAASAGGRRREAANETTVSISIIGS
jgi:hypothetical protein